MALPWGSVRNRDGSLTGNIYNNQCQCQCQCNGFGLPAGQRIAPGAPYTSDGYTPWNNPYFGRRMPFG
jgi:hypothetical protein